MFYLHSVLFAQGDFICVLWDRKRTVEMRYYFTTQDDKNKEVGKNEKYVRSVKRREGYLTMNAYY